MLSHRTRSDLAEVLALLKTQIDPALLVKKEGEEGSTSTCPNPEDEEKRKGEDNGMVLQSDLSAALI